MPHLPTHHMTSESIAAVLSTLTVLYPALRFDHAPIGQRQQRWTAYRIHSTDPGLHTVITPDLRELLNALAHQHPHTGAHAPG